MADYVPKRSIEFTRTHGRVFLMPANLNGFTATTFYISATGQTHQYAPHLANRGAVTNIEVRSLE